MLTLCWIVRGSEALTWNLPVVASKEWWLSLRLWTVAPAVTPASVAHEHAELIDFHYANALGTPQSPHIELLQEPHVRMRGTTG